MASEVDLPTGTATVNATALRRAIATTGFGLVVQLGASFYWTPITFVLSAALGLPLVLVGASLFLRAVFRFMKTRGAL